MQEFTLSLAQELFQSTEDYPVDFDLAYKWLGYTRKDNALQTLKDNFEKNVDYILLPKEGNGESQGFGARPSDIYRLTVGCLKEMGMLAKTDKGKQIRRYFLECEKLAKQSYENGLDPEIENLKKQINILENKLLLQSMMFEKELTKKEPKIFFKSDPAKDVDRPDSIPTIILEFMEMLENDMK